MPGTGVDRGTGVALNHERLDSVPREEQGRGQAHQAPADDQDGDLDFFVLPGHGLIVGLPLDIRPTELVNAKHC